uniref:Uncharacterized protein n=1 Tax=Arundo donax TaxID=35708 RepID=A0A0A9AVL8_ARUDO
MIKPHQGKLCFWNYSVLHFGTIKFATIIFSSLQLCVVSIYCHCQFMMGEYGLTDTELIIHAALPK